MILQARTITNDTLEDDVLARIAVTYKDIPPRAIFWIQCQNTLGACKFVYTWRGNTAWRDKVTGLPHH